MLLDVTLKITPSMVKSAVGNENKALVGHLGTHFDVMNKEFPLEYTRRPAIVFDVKAIRDRDIEISDIDMSKVEKDMFVGFYTGYIEEVEYGTAPYFGTHPQLSDALIEALVEKQISIIGLDCSGIRRGSEHIPKDQYCADRNVFVIENLCNLGELCGCEKKIEMNTYPMNYLEMSGLPCRVIAEIL